MICPGCGKETPSTSNYCIHCGILVQNDTAPTQLLTPEMEKMMFGEKKAGYTDDTQIISRGNKEYSVVNDGQNSIRGPEYGRPEWNNVSETSWDAMNTMGTNYQSGSSRYSGSAYSDAGTGYSDGYTGGAGAGYSDDHAGGAGSGYSDGYAGGAGSGYSDGYAGGAGSGYSDGYAGGAGSGYSDGYAGGAGSGYSDGYTSVVQGGGDGYAGAGDSQNDNSGINAVNFDDPKFAGMDMTPISVLGYIGYNILFALPLVGLIFMIIYSLGSNKKVNLKNYARSFLVMYLIGIILSVISYLVLIPMIR